MPESNLKPKDLGLTTTQAISAIRCHSRWLQRQSSFNHVVAPETLREELDSLWINHQTILLLLRLVGITPAMEEEAHRLAANSELARREKHAAEQGYWHINFRED